AVSFEFDAKKDANGDNDSNHVAVFVDGKAAQHISQTPVPFPMKNGTITDVWIDYTASNHVAKLYMTQGVAKPLLPLMTATINIYDSVDALGAGNKVWVGFTGSTDQQSSNNQDISYWVLASDGTPLTDCVQCTASNDDACKGNTPVCDPATNRCVECNTSTECTARFPSKPVCDNHVCIPCAGDYPTTSPPACFQPAKPACQTPPDGTIQG